MAHELTSSVVIVDVDLNPSLIIIRLPIPHPVELRENAAPPHPKKISSAVRRLGNVHNDVEGPTVGHVDMANILVATPRPRTLYR